MRLPRLLRTSSFRLTALYAAIFGVSGLLLFGIIGWSVNSFMAEQLDATVANELAEVQADAGGLEMPALRQVVNDLTVKSPGLLLVASAGSPGDRWQHAGYRAEAGLTEPGLAAPEE